MGEIEEGLRKEALLSQQQVQERFRKVFERDMTSLERRVFFMDQEKPELPEKLTSKSVLKLR
ncbi:MAG: hypothetical protein H0X25_15740 [Acidobacteriales bacterium]|nr:hypothetical protein [Terriglobales bacterium]